MKNLLIWPAMLLAVAAKAQFQDCTGAIFLCEKQTLVVRELKDGGTDAHEIGANSCSRFLKETHSAWIKWEVGEGGSLGFSIESLEDGDDFDFILYRINGDILDCSNRTEVRCMAAGLAIGADLERNESCLGNTGLSEASDDIAEQEGCGDGQDNFLSAMQVEDGERYLLFINNYASTKGFKLKFSGTATFRSPKEVKTVAPSDYRMGAPIVFNSKSQQNQSNFNASLLEQAPMLSFSCQSSKWHYAPNCFQSNSIERSSTQLGEFTLGRLYPNPAVWQTNFQLSAPFATICRVEVYDLLGRFMFYREYIVQEGTQVVTVDTQDLAGGLYAFRMKVGNLEQTKLLQIGWAQ